MVKDRSEKPEEIDRKSVEKELAEEREEIGEILAEIKEEIDESIAKNIENIEASDLVSEAELAGLSNAMYLRAITIELTAEVKDVQEKHLRRFKKLNSLTNELIELKGGQGEVREGVLNRIERARKTVERVQNL